MEPRLLWAPWRIEYIKGPQARRVHLLRRIGDSRRCPGACRRPRRALLHDAQARVVDRGELSFTMLNAFPHAGGHLMVAPNRHVGELEILETDELNELMALAQRAVRALREVASPNGFNVGLNLGKVAGAGFDDHLHLHVVPRWEGDTNFMPLLARTRVVPEALGATRAALAQELARLAR